MTGSFLIRCWDSSPWWAAVCCRWLWWQPAFIICRMLQSLQWSVDEHWKYEVQPVLCGDSGYLWETVCCRWLWWCVSFGLVRELWPLHTGVDVDDVHGYQSLWYGCSSSPWAIDGSLMATTCCDMVVAVLLAQWVIRGHKSLWDGCSSSPWTRGLQWLQVAVIWVWQLSLDNRLSIATSRCGMGVWVLPFQ